MLDCCPPRAELRAGVGLVAPCVIRYVAISRNFTSARFCSSASDYVKARHASRLRISNCQFYDMHPCCAIATFMICCQGHSVLERFERDALVQCRARRFIFDSHHFVSVRRILFLSTVAFCSVHCLFVCLIPFRALGALHLWTFRILRVCFLLKGWWQFERRWVAERLEASPGIDFRNLQGNRSGWL